MPYDDEDRRQFTVDGLPTDYYPSRRSRMVIGAILAGLAFLMMASSHPVFVEYVYHSAKVRLAWLFPDGRLGDFLTSGELYAVKGSMPA